MKFKQLLSIAVMSATLIGSTSPLQAVNPKPFTVPEVSNWKGTNGILPVNSLKRVTYTNPSAESIAERLAKDFTVLTGNTVSAVKTKGGASDIILSLSGKKKADESYSIDISKNRVTISAPAEEGLRWGGITLLQLCEAGKEIPQGKITDAPTYGFRGFHIDAGRKFIPLNYLYKLVDVMAYYKLNKLNLHLNDNGFKYYYDDDWDKTQAAFRVESDTYPGLTARDGAYTKDELRSFIKYAAERGVDVIPEIDFPAHSLAFTRYRPEIGSIDDEYGRDHLDLMKPETYGFLDSLLTEYLEGPDPVFAGPRFNIGTDEYSNRDSAVVEKFRYLTDRYINLTKKYGKTPLVWGSLTHARGEQPVTVDGVEMLLWSTQYANPDSMRTLGYNLISIPDRTNYIVPAAGYYHDYLDNEWLYNNWTPLDINGKIQPEGDPQILGGMFAVWNDHPTNGITVHDIHHRTMHSLPTIAAKTWSGSNVTVPYNDFIAKSSTLSEAPGVNYLARYGSKSGETVLSQAEVKPRAALPINEIGYDYTVEFDLEGAPEERGTALFIGPESTFWLSDPITGTMAYSREDKLYHLRHDVRPGEKNHYKIEGYREGVKFYVDGKLVDDMNIRTLSYNGGKNKIAEVRTLVFPLQKAGNFKSRLTNLKVTNSISAK
ncbi:MAG: family 20 glycosylhydrolase [Firmicutes bacterium]|nr:family 20 glycosylhydrolase [Bacillota bacterium]MCM1401676.1 family 20 glycosylhydrolase [Bacteroides sp.]MCM1477547.1 family 20 glycosylhydrolase [Bacteroides sp.]